MVLELRVYWLAWRMRRTVARLNSQRAAMERLRGVVLSRSV